MLATLLALSTMLGISVQSELIRITDLPSFDSDSLKVIELEPVSGRLPWTEAIVSWNIENSDRAFLRVEAQGIGESGNSPWYTLANWSGDLGKGARRSIENQSDEFGEVLVDTLRFKRPMKSLRLRLTLQRGLEGPIPKLKLMCVNLSSSTSEVPTITRPAPIPPLDVPQISQMPFEAGALKYDQSKVSGEFVSWFKRTKAAQYCSPTSLCMTLNYWQTKQGQGTLVTVPEVVAGVFDEKFPGTGNWSFNAAYAGSRPGLISYVTRLSSVEDLSTLLRAGLPVICSVAYNLLKGNGKPAGGDGHLVTLVGFDDSGDPIFNDPGRIEEVRQTYRLSNFIRAWENSLNTVYLVYPEDLKLPTLTSNTVLSGKGALGF